MRTPNVLTTRSVLLSLLTLLITSVLMSCSNANPLPPHAPGNQNPPTQHYNLYDITTNGTPEELQAAINAGADVNQQTPAGVTPLMYAAQNSTPAHLMVLINNGANLEIRNKDNQTALMLGAALGHPDNVLLLIQAGAEVNALTHKGWSPLLYATGFGYPGSVEHLLDANANIHTPFFTGEYAAYNIMTLANANPRMPGTNAYARLQALAGTQAP